MKPTQQGSIESALIRDAWFGSLPTAMQQGVLDMSSTKTLNKGQRLFSRGDPTDGVYAVLQGRLAAVDVNEHGDEAVQIHLEPVFWFGEMGLFDGLPRAHHVVAEEPSALLWLDNQRLRNFLNTEPTFWAHFGKLVTHKLRLALFLLDGRKLASNELKVARLLLRYAKGLDLDGHAMKQRLTMHQQEVADMLGLSRQTANAALQKLKSAGLIALSYNKVEIVDHAALEEKVQFHNWLPMGSH